MPLKAKMKVIGIVTTKRSRGHRLFLDIEDREDSITVMATDSEVVRKGLSILQDQVICVDAVKWSASSANGSTSGTQSPLTTP